MKVTYLERIERKMAWNRAMYCSCGSHEYEIVEQLEPKVPDAWFIRCAQCGKEGLPAPTRDVAIGRWKQL